MYLLTSDTASSFEVSFLTSVEAGCSQPVFFGAGLSIVAVALANLPNRFARCGWVETFSENQNQNPDSVWACSMK